MAKIKSGFYWLVHHKVLLEWCYDYDARVDVIERTKPKNEVPTRLSEFKPVKGKLPAAVVKTQAAYRKAGAAYRKALAASDKAHAAYIKAIHAHKAEIEALHHKECPDSAWNGETLVFPKS